MTLRYVRIVMYQQGKQSTHKVKTFLQRNPLALSQLSYSLFLYYILILLPEY